MIGIGEMLSPSFLLFPALIGSLILGLVCPLVGAHLILRRTVLLGLTLPQIAAAGVAFTFWLQQVGVFPAHAGEHGMGMVGSLLFTFAAMALLGYLERRGKGLAEGRLAAAYALGGSLTILFIVFNPAGETEILSLLKGEVIALSRAESRVLAAVFGAVFLAMLYFRREFLLSSFDRDLAFLLKGHSLSWDVMLYLLAGVSIAVGVIMAGPLLVFGFMVLPALAARPLAKGMTAFMFLSSLLGFLTALFGFYLSVRLDLPLGPTDVAFGCLVVFLAYGLRRFGTRFAIVPLMLIVLLPACSAPPGAPPPAPRALGGATVWFSNIRNSTGEALRFPDANPLRSLGEIAGKLSSDARPTVMDELRAALNREFQARGFLVSFPEQRDKRLSSFPSEIQSAARNAREGGLRGALLLSEIRRWEVVSRQLTRVVVDFKLVRIDDGALLWERRVQRAIPTASATNLGDAYRDAVRAVTADVFGA